MAEDSIEQNDTQTEPSTPENASTEPEKVFTQDEVDALIKKRLDKRNREIDRKFDGVDPDEYRAIKAAQEAEELERQKERGEFENVMKQTVEKWESKTSALQDELRRVKVDGALLSAASRGKAINAEQVANLLRSNVRMTDDGSVEIVDSNGTARYDDHGQPLTPDALVDEFLSGNPHFVAATPSGTGSQSSIGGGLEKKGIMDMSHDEYREWRKSNRNQTKGYIKMA
tara:strand:+ start:618 stop:1301 length:684 start_codon:yes stop_codon:yes gene_type:complete